MALTKAPISQEDVEPANTLWYSEQGLKTHSGDLTFMSTALGFIGIDGIVLATDSRETITTEGSQTLNHKDDTQKIHQLTPSIGLITHGNAVSYSWQLLDLFSKQDLSQLNDIDDYSDGFGNFVRGF